MIVVVILGIIVAMLLPDYQLWRSDQRIREGAYDVLRAAREAQYASVRDGVAYALVYEDALDGGHGTLTAFRGMTNRCTRADWPDAVGGFGPSGMPSRLVNYNPNALSVFDANRHVIQADAFFRGNPALQRNVVICYEPSGNVYTTPAGNANPGVPNNLGLQRIDLFFDVYGTFNGANSGVMRRVMFPAGGSPRILQGEDR